MAIRVAYISSLYRSHARAAALNRSALTGIVEFTEDPTDADVVILHDEPHLYPSYFKQHPTLHNRYVIAYAVWEASTLPLTYIEGLALVDEVWTCSKYCVKLFKRYHNVVIYIPHIIEDACTPDCDDENYVSNYLSKTSECVYLLAVARLWDLRKNMHGLLKSFIATSGSLPNARLVIKTSDARDAMPLKALDQRIIPITAAFSEGEMRALYASVDVFLSPHRSEGWGFCIADALASGCLVVATRYSGPLDYLKPANSIEIPFKVVDVAREQEYGLFDQTMQWAEPSLDALTEIIQSVVHSPSTEEYNLKRKQARAVCTQFSREYVTRLLVMRLAFLEWIITHKWAGRFLLRRC